MEETKSFGDMVVTDGTRTRSVADEERLRAKIPGFLRGDVARRLADACPYRDSWTLIKAAKQTMQAVARSPAEAYLHTLSLVKESERRALFSPSLAQDLQGYRAFEVFDQHYRAAPSDHPVGKVQWADLMTYLPGDILTKVDRASMAHSLEVRVPLLDHHLVAWAHTLPPDKKLRDGEGKFILKKAMDRALPSDLLYRKKMGFAVPLDEWFRGPLAKRAQEAFSTGPLGDCGLFRPDLLMGALDSHRKGRRNLGSLLWAFLMFDAFLRNVHSAPAKDRTTAPPNGFEGSEAAVIP
jgi:asparagine synthase (glutamine-hydrolysing)